MRDDCEGDGREGGGPPRVRWMVRGDLPEVLAIEEASFEEPWTEGRFLSVLRERSSIGMVAEVGGRVAGYMLYRLRPRTVELLTFAVSPARRNRGVGTRLLAKLVEKIDRGAWPVRRRTAIEAEVPEEHVAFLMFLRKRAAPGSGLRLDCKLRRSDTRPTDAVWVRVEHASPAWSCPGVVVVEECS